MKAHLRKIWFDIKGWRRKHWMSAVVALLVVLSVFEMIAVFGTNVTSPDLFVSKYGTGPADWQQDMLTFNVSIEQPVGMGKYVKFFNRLGASWTSLDTLGKSLENIEDEQFRAELQAKTLKARAILQEADESTLADLKVKSLKESSVKETINLATVACGQRTIEMMVMLKSALMFSRDAKLHVIIFGDVTLPVLAEAVLEFKWRVNTIGLDFTFEFHEAWFPEQDRMKWKQMYQLCATQRLFFPQLLPKTDSVLFLDTDVIVMADLLQTWKKLKVMNDTQLAAAAPNTEDSANGFYNLYSQVPYYGKRGVNAGIMLMNLTRMRQFDFVNKSLAAYALYGDKIQLADQDIINIIFSGYPERFLRLSCTYNFMWIHCGLTALPNYNQDRLCLYEKEPGPQCFCFDALENGVHIVHGNSKTFHSYNYPMFSKLFRSMMKFNILTGSYSKLLSEIKQSYDMLEKPCFMMTAEQLVANAWDYFDSHGLLTS